MFHVKHIKRKLDKMFHVKHLEKDIYKKDRGNVFVVVYIFLTVKSFCSNCYRNKR